MWKENTATPPTYIDIFVFGDEVFNIVIRVSLLMYRVDLFPMRYTPIYPLGIFHHLSSQNVCAARPMHNMNRRTGRQKISSFDATHHYQPAP